MRSVLPDANIFIRALKGEEPEASFFSKLLNAGKIYISVVAASEFLVKAKEGEAEFFERLLAELPVLNIDLEVARVGAEYRKLLIKRTKRTILLDCFLAAQAKVHHLTLVTNNKGDFPMRDIKIITPKKRF